MNRWSSLVTLGVFILLAALLAGASGYYLGLNDYKHARKFHMTSHKITRRAYQFGVSAIVLILGILGWLKYMVKY